MKHYTLEYFKYEKQIKEEKKHINFAIFNYERDIKHINNLGLKHSDIKEAIEYRTKRINILKEQLNEINMIESLMFFK